MKISVKGGNFRGYVEHLLISLLIISHHHDVIIRDNFTFENVFAE